MAKAQRRIPRSIEFSEPIVAGSTPQGASRTAKVLNERLDLLCAEFGITSANRNKYRELCLVLLADVIGLPGFQILGKPAKRGRGAPVVWTLERHVSLVSFVAGRPRKVAIKVAINQARKKFSKELSDPLLTDSTVKAEYYRAKKFFKSAPRAAAAMMAAALASNGNASGARLSEFLKDGAQVFTSSGLYAIGPNHIRKTPRTIDKARHDRLKE